MIKKLIPVILLIFMFSVATAQPFLLKSTNAAKSFHLDIYYGTEGKGAFIKYRGQQGIISLKLKSRVSQGEKGQPKIIYVWDEVIKGKVTGTYGLTQETGKISEVWYRNNDKKTFQLEHVPDQEEYAGIGKYLLHGVLISFHHTSAELLTFNYSDGSIKNSQLPGFDHPDPQRQGTIADYNFDGYDDLAFSIPDAGMGVYRTFSVYLYNPSTKRFDLLPEPNASRAKCSGLCEVTLDKKNKLFITACRGAATWWKDVYKLSPYNTLIWVSSSKILN
ncbi:hypothetical protein [Pedobacter sp. UYP1]|uniref:XAC2610-related protein n=1 Tax=Pedobacter sp. UYP1 TaxID=1756396 RepID=UPI0033939FDB